MLHRFSLRSSPVIGVSKDKSLYRSQLPWVFLNFTSIVFQNLFFMLFFASPQHPLTLGASFQSHMLCFPSWWIFGCISITTSFPFRFQQLHTELQFKRISWAVSDIALKWFNQIFLLSVRVLPLFLIQHNLQINCGDSCSCVHHMYTAFIMSPAWLEFFQDFSDTQNSDSPLLCQDTECFAFPVIPPFSLPVSCRNLLWDQPTYWLLGTP